MQQAQQLELIKVVPKPVERPVNEAFEAFLEKGREEYRLWREAADELGIPPESPGLMKDRRWTVSELRQIRAHLESQGKIQSTDTSVFRPPATYLQQPYRVQPLDRKQRTRCTKTLNRHRKRLPLGGWWMDAAQQDLAKRPWYFGVCSLPDQEAAIAPDYDGDMRQSLAIERENALRNQANEQLLRSQGR